MVGDPLSSKSPSQWDAPVSPEICDSEDDVFSFGRYMGVSKNSGTPKWMLIMENPIKMDDLGYHYFWKHPYI